MVLKKILASTSTAILLLFCACGPVKFSGSSSEPTPDPSTNNNDQTNTDDGTQNGGSQTRDVTTNYTIKPRQNKVDILVIADNSSSMEVDNKKLGERLNTFVTALESAQIDWQMCLVVTSPVAVNGTDYWGASIKWGSSTTTDSTYYNDSQNWILKRKNGINLNSIFKYTLENNLGVGGRLTNDERGIKSAYWHLSYKDYNKCYRSDAAFAQIYISDEDERSIGGRSSEKVYTGEYYPLEADDQPSQLVDLVKTKLGQDVQFRANAIIVKDKDQTCLDNQNTQPTKAHFGLTYQQLAGITGGGAGSICDTDYYNNLSFFNDVINDSLESMPIECNPVSNEVTTTFTPDRPGTTVTVQGQSLLFNPSVPSGTTVTASYKCSLLGNNRAPNSVTPVATTQGFWAKMYNWIILPIINLFK